MFDPCAAIELRCLMDLNDEPKLGTKTLLDYLADRGVYILIHTSFVSEDSTMSIEEAKMKVEEWLKTWNLPWDAVWTGQGKPMARWFVETWEDLALLTNDRLFQSS